MSPTFWVIAFAVGAAALAASFLLVYQRGKQRTVVELTERLAAAEERLAAAERGEVAQDAQEKAQAMAQGRMLTRAARRVRERLRREDPGGDG